MNSGKLTVVGSLLLLLVAIPSWAQAAHYSVPAASVSVEDAFSVYQEALSGTADRLLAATAKREPEPQSLGDMVNARRPDADELRLFAERYWGGREEDVRSGR